MQIAHVLQQRSRCYHESLRQLCYDLQPASQQQQFIFCPVPRKQPNSWENVLIHREFLKTCPIKKINKKLEKFTKFQANQPLFQGVI